jgi:integrating conjugative element protein (TIGR03757 family)
MTTAHTALASLMLLSLLANPSARTEDMKPLPTRIVIFTVSDQPIRDLNRFRARHPEVVLRLHRLDTIHQFQERLSVGLPADRNAAKRMVLGRLQDIGKPTRDDLEQGAAALMEAVQSGVEKFPAMVFDDEWVVYGLLDLSTAFSEYRNWQGGETQ